MYPITILKNAIYDLRIIPYEIPTQFASYQSFKGGKPGKNIFKMLKNCKDACLSRWAVSSPIAPKIRVCSNAHCDYFCDSCQKTVH